MAAVSRNGVRAAKSMGGMALFGKRWFSTGGDLGVFWDLNKCGLQEYHSSQELDPLHIAPNIVQALRISGFSGRICIHAYGNTRCFSQHHFVQALLATGVDLHHVSGGRNELNNHLLLELLLWAKENSPPSHMLLISGENSLSSVMHKLRMRGFGILLAYPEESIPSDLLGAAEKVWAWESMMKGIASPCVLSSFPHLGSSNIMSHGSTRPQALSGQDTQIDIDAKSMSKCPDKKKPHKIPEKVIKQVLDIIRLRPGGLTLGAFKRQLGKSNVVLDKGYYGHKDLFTFLMAVPKLKASIVWTTDRTRAYFFREDLTSESTGDIRDDEKGRPLGSVDDDKNVSSKEDPRKKTRMKSSQHSSLEDSQHLEMKPATSMEYGKESIVAMVADVCRRSLSMLRLVFGFKNVKTDIAPLMRQFDKENSQGNGHAKTDMALSMRQFDKQNSQDNGHGRHNNSGVAQTIEKDAEPFPSQGEETFEMDEQMSDVAKDKEADSGCLPRQGVESLVEQNKEPENSQDQKSQQHLLNLSLQSEPCVVPIEKQCRFLLSEEREHDFIQEVLKSTCLTEQLCKEITCRLFSESQSCELTRATSMDELVKVLTKVLHLCGASLNQKELNHLAELINQRIQGHVPNEAESSMGETKIDLGLHREEEEMPPAQHGLDAARDLIDMIMESKYGLFMRSIKPEFLRRYGYELDNKALGHPSLSSFVRSLNELTVIKDENNEHVVLFRATDEMLENGEEGAKALTLFLSKVTNM